MDAPNDSIDVESLDLEDDRNICSTTDKFTFISKSNVCIILSFYSPKNNTRLISLNHWQINHFSSI